MDLLPRTPLPPDPGYEQDCNFYPRGDLREPTPRRRNRPEAESIAHRHTSGSVGLLFQTQAQSTRSRYRRPDPKNHSKENMHRIRQIQAQSKRIEQEKKVEKEQKTAIVKSNKYDHIQAKVTIHMRPHSTTPLHHSSPPSQATPPPPSQSTPLQPSPLSQKKQSEFQLELPKKCVGFKPVGKGPRRHHGNETSVSDGPLPDDDSGLTRKNKNFLAANIHAASQHQVKRPPTRQHLDQLQSKKEQDLQQYKRGVIPQYLCERRVEWRRAEEERIAALPDPSVPPGHTLMPNMERVKTLQVLREHEATLTAELTRLPLYTDSIRIKSHRAELESKLSEIDDALKIFSRQKVFIKMDQ